MFRLGVKYVDLKKLPQYYFAPYCIYEKEKRKGHRQNLRTEIDNLTSKHSFNKGRII